MSATVVAPPPVTTVQPAPVRRGGLHRLSVAQYHAMIDAGILKPGAKVELVEGLLLRKPMTRKPPHESTMDLAEHHLRALLPAGWFIRSQRAVTLPSGEPEPDIAVVLGPVDRYADHHPHPGEIGLVVEVADTSVRVDRGPKLRDYARAGIPAYWVVNLKSGEVEVYADPHTPARNRPKYRTSVTFAAGQSIPVVLAGGVVGSIPVSDILR